MVYILNPTISAFKLSRVCLPGDKKVFDITNNDMDQIIFNIEGDINSETLVNPDDCNTVYSELLTNLKVEKIYEKNTIIGIISYIKDRKL